MIYSETFFLEAELVDDGTLDTVVSIKNQQTQRTTTYRFDSESVQYPEVLELAKDQYLEELAEFLQFNSNF